MINLKLKFITLTFFQFRLFKLAQDKIYTKIIIVLQNFDIFSIYFFMFYYYYFLISIHFQCSHFVHLYSVSMIKLYILK